MENKRKTSNPAPPRGGLQGASAPPSGGLRGAVVIEVGGERHRLVREPNDIYETPQCEKCSLSFLDCDLCCEDYKDNYNYDYYFVKEEEYYEKE